MHSPKSFYNESQACIRKSEKSKKSEQGGCLSTDWMKDCIKRAVNFVKTGKKLGNYLIFFKFKLKSIVLWLKFVNWKKVEGSFFSKLSLEGGGGAS